MPKTGKKVLRRSRHRGHAIIITIVSFATLMGIASLAVDFGRVMETKSELRRVVDAAARAGAYALNTVNNTPTNQSVINAVNKIMNMPGNTVNGANVALVTVPPRGGTSDIQWGTWDGSNFHPQANVAGANAVQVTASLTAAKGNAVPMTLVKFLGFNSCNINRVLAVAEWHSASWTPAGLPTKDSKGNSIITAKGNIYLAGQTVTGTTASVPWDPTSDYNQTTGANQSPTDKAAHPWEHDIYGTYGGSDIYGQPYETPAQAFTDPTTGAVTTALVPGATIVVTDVTGNATNVNSGAPDYTADGSRSGTYNVYQDVGSTDPNVSSYTGEGNSGTNTINGQTYASVIGSEHGISNISSPLNALLGVFLSNTNPDNDSTNATPPGMDFSTGNARNYTAIAPAVKQAFYIGDGQTSSQTQQSFTVPANATRLFLGTMDGQEWSNNQGGYSMTITQYWVTLVK
jgi:Flp pilus assembly protein TadG